MAVRCPQMTQEELDLGEFQPEDVSRYERLATALPVDTEVAKPCRDRMRVAVGGVLGRQ